MIENAETLTEYGLNELELLEFYLDNIDNHGNSIRQSYVINVSKIRKIDQLPTLTELPAKGRGIIGGFFMPKVHESFITAIDLGEYLFKKTNVNYNERKIVIVAQFNQFLCGFVVDGINRIHKILWSDVVSPKYEYIETENSLVVGVVKHEDRSLLLIDVEKIVIDLGLVTLENNNLLEESFISKPKILLVEDSPFIGKMIVGRLQALGCELILFPNGLLAWEYLEDISKTLNQDNPLSDYVDCIITDIEMPKLDGYTLTTMIRENYYLKHLPVIIFSAMINEDVIVKGWKAGADAQISKPQIGELTETLMLLINNKEEFLKNRNMNFYEDDDDEDFYFEN